MADSPQRVIWESLHGWSTISAREQAAFTLWFTGLPGTGKTTLANMVKKTLLSRGFKLEIIDPQALTYWLKQQFPADEIDEMARANTPGLGAMLTYICTLLARNEIITITTTVSPYRATRLHARQQIRHFIEVYLRRSAEQRATRLLPMCTTGNEIDNVYEPPIAPELSFDTGAEAAEHCALRIITYLEEHGNIAPLWEKTYADADVDDESLLLDEEVSLIKARLQALGYLE